MSSRKLDNAIRQVVTDAHGRATAVHYALYLPNLRKIHEE